MFSCFCDTFCCCLHRFHDSSSRDTPTSSSNTRSKNKNVDQPEGAQKEGEDTSNGRAGNIEDVQPAPRLPMPQLGGALAESDTSKRESSSHQSDAHSEEPSRNPDLLSVQPRASPFSSFVRTHIRRRSQDPPQPNRSGTSTPRIAASETRSVTTASASGPSTPRATYQSLNPQPPIDAGQARGPGAFLSTLDDMPSASDFLVASEMPDFDNDVELEVPPQGQIPELPGADSTQAWREESGPPKPGQMKDKEHNG